MHILSVELPRKHAHTAPQWVDVGELSELGKLHTAVLPFGACIQVSVNPGGARVGSCGAHFCPFEPLNLWGPCSGCCLQPDTSPQWAHILGLNHINNNMQPASQWRPFTVNSRMQIMLYSASRSSTNASHTYTSVHSGHRYER